MPVKKTLAVVLSLVAPVAQAKPHITGKVSVEGVSYVEQEQAVPPPSVGQVQNLAAAANQASLASPVVLAFADLRVLLTALNLARDRLDVGFDMRVRGTQSFDFESKFNPAYQASPSLTITGRGYLGGPEFDLRVVDVGLHLTQRATLVLGRMFVSEADMLKVDGARLKLAFGQDRHVEGSLFFGGHPNPYSRSLLTDYNLPCGDGVASGNAVLLLKDPVPGTAPAVPAAGQPCQTADPQLALTGGLTARYQYPLIWGSAGLVGSFFGGRGDGGPVVADDNIVDRVGNLRRPSDNLDAPRIYLSWTNQLHPAEWFNLFSDLVVDFFGSHGTQLTRALVAGHFRVLAEDRLSVRVNYSYMSALAIDMYLSRLLYNRAVNGTTLGGLGVVENNLTVLRTGRHEARLALDSRAAGKLVLFVEGRFRQRALLDGDRNPAVYQSPLYTDHYTSEVGTLAGDATLGVRDGGSVLGLRALLAYTYLADYRARTHVLRAGLGRDLWHERLGLDVEYVLLGVRDLGADQDGCAKSTNLNPPPGRATDQIDPRASVFFADCFGRRSGLTHEAGATITLSPWRRLFFLLDYRFTAMLTDPQAGQAIATVLSHGLLARAEYGF